jgi:hypothetical protein
VGFHLWLMMEEKWMLEAIVSLSDVDMEMMAAARAL